MNGYPRDTNAFTSKIDGVISFRNMRSCGTATAVSVPCMFSDMNRTDYDGKKAAGSENVLDIVQKTGFRCCGKKTMAGVKAYAAVSRLSKLIPVSVKNCVTVKPAMTMLCWKTWIPKSAKWPETS